MRNGLEVASYGNKLRTKEWLRCHAAPKRPTRSGQAQKSSERLIKEAIPLTILSCAINSDGDVLSACRRSTLKLPVDRLERRLRFALSADETSAILLRYVVFRLGHSHQPFIEPADDVLESFDAMPWLA